MLCLCNSKAWGIALANAAASGGIKLYPYGEETDVSWTIERKEKRKVSLGTPGSVPGKRQTAPVEREFRRRERRKAMKTLLKSQDPEVAEGQFWAVSASTP